ncbi:MAG: chorismate mutase, partial [Bacteroidales bacterium]|nr:chorismate mutase [Bacteroidales bacterium]
LADLLAVVNFPDSNKVSNSLLSLRESLNETDKVIIEALARRMQLSESIAKVKQKENMTVFQANRWEEVLKTLLANAERKGLNKDFIKEIYEIIHQESIKIQNITIKKSRE